MNNRHRYRDLIQLYILRLCRVSRLFSIVGIVVIATGCATEEVILRHPETHDIAKCGLFAAPTAADRLAAVSRTRECVEDYQRQGYERLL